VKPRFEVYKAVSQQIREIFAEHTAIIGPLSLDEAYVTENLQGISLARDVALAIRLKIKEVTGLDASAGISYNKFLAKLASVRPARNTIEAAPLTQREKVFMEAGRIFAEREGGYSHIQRTKLRHSVTA
jgi:nucleotidyltransferase/DNA polymerase involved in DNA repair